LNEHILSVLWNADSWLYTIHSGINAGLGTEEPAVPLYTASIHWSRRTQCTLFNRSSRYSHWSQSPQLTALYTSHPFHLSSPHPSSRPISTDCHGFFKAASDTIPLGYYGRAAAPFNHLPGTDKNLYMTTAKCLVDDNGIHSAEGGDRDVNLRLNSVTQTPTERYRWLCWPVNCRPCILSSLASCNRRLSWMQQPLTAVGGVPIKSSFLQPP